MVYGATTDTSDPANRWGQQERSTRSPLRRSMPVHVPEVPSEERQARIAAHQKWLHNCCARSLTVVTVVAVAAAIYTTTGSNTPSLRGDLEELRADVAQLPQTSKSPPLIHPSARPALPPPSRARQALSVPDAGKLHEESPPSTLHPLSFASMEEIAKGSEGFAWSRQGVTPPILSPVAADVPAAAEWPFASEADSLELMDSGKLETCGAGVGPSRNGFCALASVDTHAVCAGAMPADFCKTTGQDNWW